MRLLKYEEDGDLNIIDFDDNTIPPYAILSHTWGADAEVTFADPVTGDGMAKRGYEKIHFCGQQARQDGLQYFWVTHAASIRQTRLSPPTPSDSCFAGTRTRRSVMFI
ncbi:hypothetical protein BU23DRAFT_636813 [Bimuria novae-zelandiae CBS 107.79]|uniref:Heterokaryon incompatibility domain-containing protein n=1 Tax=Bimuria novae-zelandiae CBS 107.79 TaxID=1447943 RepID=A0A6A5VSR6_9PLEO|nr:hypothetical protein BU23DRAFT_636813 [Bimuria novae-zelandiae CBS 107.79]